MPKLIAIVEHRYGNTLHKPGDVYEATDRHANLLTRVKKAKYASADEAKSAPAKAPIAKPAEEPPAKPGRFKRRDMRAES